ncbi:MAG: hypothetical protein RL033_6056 [Pseudomonadota bacterium]|jgi:hypothetical protein
MSTMPTASDGYGRFFWLRAYWSRSASLALGLPLVAALGCGGGTKGAEGAEGAKAGKSEILWKDKTRAQRIDWMGLQVFPKLKSAFQELDGSRFSDFKCQTCHSDEMEMVDFKMPNTKIYALPRTNTVQSAREYDEKVTEFMLNTVTPKMAELLDMPVYDPQTKSGFGCFGCHPSE